MTFGNAAHRRVEEFLKIDVLCELFNDDILVLVNAQKKSVRARRCQLEYQKFFTRSKGRVHPSIVAKRRGYVARPRRTPLLWQA